MPFYANTGFSISLIRRDLLQYFPRVPIKVVQNGKLVKIEGVVPGQLIKTTKYIELPITLLVEDGEIIYYYGEVHVVDELPILYIIGTRVLTPNNINFKQRYPEGKPTLLIQGYYILLRFSVFLNGVIVKHYASSN